MFAEVSTINLYVTINLRGCPLFGMFHIQATTNHRPDSFYNQLAKLQKGDVKYQIICQCFYER